MAGHAPTDKFDNKTVQWINDRLPVFSFMKNEYGKFPTPINFNYFWNFGAIAMAMLGIMIATGIFLAMNYTPHETLAFESVERMTRDVNYGWLMRYVHMNGASFFFIAVYIHIFRGLFYGSYKKPREMVWIFGVVIFLLMMATAFMGYALPWSQMSGWGVTVITSLFSAIPLVGDGLVTWLWGGFSVGNPTLNRFYALHFLLPFVICAVVFVHVWALHVTGSNNPTGVEPKSEKETVPFHPYYTTKDSFGTVVFLIFFFAVVFFAPLQLAEVDHFRQYDALQTPAHIVPEWYFLPFYAILRSFTMDITEGLMGLAALGLMFALPVAYFTLKNEKQRDLALKGLGALLGVTLFVMLLALVSGDLKGGGFKAFINLVVVPAKLQGVLAMFGSIIILFFLPWLDTSPVRSARYRPIYSKCLLLLVVAMGALTYAGAKPPEGLPVIIGRLGTIYYFLHFLVLVPLLGKKEKTLALPNSISDAVKKGAIVLAFGLMMLGSAQSFAAPAKEAAPATAETAAAKAIAETVPAAAATAAPAEAPAKAEEAELLHQKWPDQGIFGTFDKASLQRGYQVYKEVCSACHAMKFVSYRNLADLGYNADEIKSLAATFTVTDGPNDDGEMFERPATPADHFKSPFKNDKAARAANGGALPPDMSLLVKAREGGEDYVYGILNGFENAPAGFAMQPGLNYNKVFPGHQIAMAKPLNDGQVAYGDGTPNSLDQEARDVAHFLAWASEPHMEQRKQMGIKVILFMIMFAGILLRTKRKVWSKIH